jgi:hypothetical protein
MVSGILSGMMDNLVGTGWVEVALGGCNKKDMHCNGFWNMNTTSFINAHKQ